jgi:processive 1,2-diacylglycerol beta-glucosyltransferase
VPAEQCKNKFISEGIPPQKIKIWGIPVEPKFEKTLDRHKILSRLQFNSEVPILLIMGGGQGLGPIEEIVWALNNSRFELQLIVATGTNKPLRQHLLRKQKYFKKRILVLEHVDNIDELMTISKLIITKPGGLTTAEALAKELPMVVISPIPGQEEKNTQFLVKEGIGLKAENENSIVDLVYNLLSNPARLEQMRLAAKKHARADSARRIAQMLLEL